ncbi:MAG: hypothetical protein P4L99_11155 [Chthoniobacter sp.]|nr:hypothetical protein [Chthoniobacter sp.]
MITRHLLSRFGTKKFHPFGTVFAALFITTILAGWFAFSIAKGRNQAEAERQTAVAALNVAKAARQMAERPSNSIPPK